MKNEDLSFNKHIKTFWKIFASGIAFIILLFILIALGVLGKMPTFEELDNPRSSLASEVISSDGKVLGTFFKENRTGADYNEISSNVINALVATEDVRFFKHSGVDVWGLGRVFWGIVTLNSGSGGGSTITQQLAKQLFPREHYHTPFSFGIRKFKEWIIAVQLEKRYTKEEIITMYLNKFDFVNLAVGIQSASQIYFDTTPDKLELQQAAMLIGMCKNPAFYNPLRRPDETLERRNVVLSQMLKYDYITQDQYDNLKTLPLGLKYHPADFKSGPAPYFREYLRQILTAEKPNKSDYPSWQTEKYKEDSDEWDNNPLYGWCNKNLRPDGKPYNLYTDGLKIYTSIDSRMQKYAEDAVVHHLRDYLQPEFDKKKQLLKNPPFANNLSAQETQGILDRAMKQSERYRVSRQAGKSDSEIRDEFNRKISMRVFSWHGDKNVLMSPFDSIRYYLGFLRSSMMVMEPQTGYVKAYVGGPDYSHFMYDMVKVGKRQVGSTVKPFLYTLAMQNGFTPNTMVPNAPVTFQLSDGSSWTAKNAGRTGKEGQMVSLRWGLANSVNQISAWIMKQFNPENVVTVMQKMGVYSPIDPVPSIFLGTSDISLYEMVGAYGTFVNKGIFSKPIFVTRIENKNGTNLAQFKSPQSEAIDEQTAYLMIDLLKGVVNQGTAQRLRWHPDYGGFTAEMGGKTGTTQNQSDGWFMGLLPRLVTGVWTGADVRGVHFSDQTGEGGNAALPIFGYFMKKVYADRSLGYSQSEKFVAPQNSNRSNNGSENSDSSSNSENNSSEKSNTSSKSTANPAKQKQKPVLEKKAKQKKPKQEDPFF